MRKFAFFTQPLIDVDLTQSLTETNVYHYHGYISNVQKLNVKQIKSVVSAIGQEIEKAQAEVRRLETERDETLMELGNMLDSRVVVSDNEASLLYLFYSFSSFSFSFSVLCLCFSV